MADLLYNPYAEVDCEVSHNVRFGDIRTRQSSQDLNDQEAETKSAKATSFRRFKSLELRSICVCLHLLPILIHLALFFVRSHQFEHRVIVSLSSSGNISSFIVTTSQFLATIYTLVMVVVMQQFTTRGMLLKHQTLTATHDESTAWAGLGSALLVLWRQTRIAASVIGTLSVAIYLIAISVLHISTPSLFNLQVFQNPNASNITTKIGMPNIISSNMTFEDWDIFWANSAPLMPYIARGNLSGVIGVENGTLYDILDDNNSTGNVAVGAKSFNVTCGSLPNISVTANSSHSNGWIFSMTVAKDSPFHGINYNLSVAYPNVVGYLDGFQLSEQCTTFTLGRNMIFYFMGPTIVTDFSGKVSSRASIRPPTVIDLGNGLNLTVSDITVIGCTLSIVNQSAVVDARTKKLVSVHPDATKTESEWLPWNPPVPAAVNDTPNDPQIIGAWQSMFEMMPDGNAPLHKTDLASQFVMERLGLHAQILPPYPGNPEYSTQTQVTLPQIENVLADITAAMYWAATNVQPDYWFQKAVDSEESAAIPVLQGWAQGASTETHLNINTFSLTLGLVASLVLFVTTAVLIRRFPHAADAGVDVPGILPNMWIAYKHPQLRSLFLQVVEPTVDNLRAIGMVEMRLTEEQPQHISN